jgi:hypothetical protein
MRADDLTLVYEAGGFAIAAQLLTVMTRQELDVQVKNGGRIRVWYGVYAATEPDLLGRLDALDLFMGHHVVACMATAARLYGFDLENTTAIHVFDLGVRMRPRALATLDGALRSGWCTRRALERAVLAQGGRRGIVSVRELLSYTDARAESAMESEARLVMIDHGARFASIQELGRTLIPIVVDDVRRYPDRLAGRIAEKGITYPSNPIFPSSSSRRMSRCPAWRALSSIMCT